MRQFIDKIKNREDLSFERFKCRYCKYFNLSSFYSSGTLNSARFTIGLNIFCVMFSIKIQDKKWVEKITF